MLAIKFEFTANRYHATQWGRHVNEGVPEWPPSPWRILRGIVAVWRRTLPEIPEGRVAPVLEALASEYPEFHLPPASTGHTRHYMPYNEGAKERTTLVIDSFVAVQPGKQLFAIWPNVDLDAQRRDDLDRILRNMPYLGRAESWVQGEIARAHPKPNSYALEDGTLPEGDLEIVRTLVPRSPIDLKALQIETSELRGAGRIDPEDAQWWPYVRERDCFTSYRTAETATPERGEGAAVVRFALAGNVLPMAFDTLRWGEVARDAAMSYYGGRNNKTAKSPTLSGRDEESGKPLEGHKHAFYLPADEDGDGKLDHLTVWASYGLTPQEFEALVSMQELNRGGGREPLQLVYQAHGKESDFSGVSPIFGKSKRWRSITPYVLPRHTKFRGPKDDRHMIDGPVEQIEREIDIRWPGLSGRVTKVADRRTRIAPMREGRSSGFRPFEFFRFRKRGSTGGGAFNFEIEFDQPVQGPIALGFACHYGLGLFVPVQG